MLDQHDFRIQTIIKHGVAMVLCVQCGRQCQLQTIDIKSKHTDSIVERLWLILKGIHKLRALPFVTKIDVCCVSMTVASNRP